ncbi:hypothetical protein [Parasphingorhabdus cellanae]|uniref:Uncharacterized protein n=1 Tax=Parasphingorhabdus cellanae TaxID=2806553 RepID=A0ABX7TA53_9SPHN|nr:hypothetical protein [Parasphingorhabdus cellanae]QTD57043.1 hypothetical protein J4G78_05650 [Parasphingorhabdus cellanae]
MRFKTLAALSALSLSVAPAMAQSQAVAPVTSASAERVSATQEQTNNLGGGSDTIIGVLAGAIAVGFITLTVINDDDDDDNPTSP